MDEAGKSVREPHLYDISEVAKQISKSDKTSMAIDREKVAAARDILGTRTMAETVDAALDEVIRQAAWRRLMQRIRREGGIGPSPAELRRLRRPRIS